MHAIEATSAQRPTSRVAQAAAADFGANPGKADAITLIVEEKSRRRHESHRRIADTGAAWCRPVIVAWLGIAA